MHAIVCDRHGPAEVMGYVEVPMPEPAAGEVLIQAEAIGVNYVDTMRRGGNHPTAPRPPFTPGIELCGRAAGLGPQVAGFKIGERVIARCVTHGAYAEYVCAEARFTASCPESLPPEQGAALFVNGLTAWHALTTVGQARAGEWVLITAAAGGVGTCALQLAKAVGAHVMAAAGSAEKLDLARQLGADVPIDYSRPDWHEDVLAASGGRGASLILESVGGDVFQHCLRCWAARGRLVIFGRASGKPGVVTGDDLLFGNRTAHGLALGMIIEDTEVLRSSMQQLFDMCLGGRLRVVIGRTFPLREAAAAHRHLESRQSRGKIVLLP